MTITSLKANQPKLLENIRKDKVISEDTEQALKEFYDSCLAEYLGEEQAA